MTWTLSAAQLNKIAAAKLRLISQPQLGRGEAMDLPYLATALYALVSVAQHKVARVAVDEKWRLYVNPDWLDEVDVSQLSNELAALTWHLLMEHSVRAASIGVDRRTAHIWRLAAALTVVDTLAESQVVPTRYLEWSNRLHKQLPSLAKHRSVEEYYRILIADGSNSLESLVAGDDDTDGEEFDESGGSGIDGVRRSYDLPSDPDLNELDEVAATQVRQVVAIEYEQYLKGCGDTPGEAGRWMKQILDPKIRWEELLVLMVRRAIGYAAGRSEYTRSRPSRRQSILPNIVLPGTRRPLPRMAMVIDTSGSVDDELLGRALGEVDGALRAIGIQDSQLAVFSCDAAVTALSKVHRARDVQLIGGGGTNMAAGINAAAALRPPPAIIVVFTDGWTPWPPSPLPGIVVIAALLGRPGEEFPETPGWVRTIECRI